MSLRAAFRIGPLEKDLMFPACLGLAIGALSRQTHVTQHTRQISNRKGSAPR